MGLVLRRAATARSLLASAALAALVCTALLTGSTVHARRVLAEGTRTTVDTAARDERSLVVRGPWEPRRFTDRDAAVRALTGPRFGGVGTDVRVAGYAAARQFAGATGAAVPDDDGRVYAAVVCLQDLAAHAELLSGAWPVPGATPTQVTLGSAVADTLGVRTGDRITILDRFTDRRSDVRVVGVWRPRDAEEPYWELFPAVAAGANPGSSTYGPVVLDRADFLAGYTASASAAWVVEPRLAGVTPDELRTLGAAATEAVDGLPAAAGFGTSAVAVSRLAELARRAERADLVGRSALSTPMLLLAVLGGYTLLLISLMLAEQRTAETALLRARGAGRGRLAGIAAREVALVVAPAVLLAPWAAILAVRRLDPAGPGPWPDRYAWGVTLAAALSCAVVMLLPALRSGGTYVATLTSRPGRRTALQRAGVDLMLLVAALLGWWQLRRYSAPVTADAGGRLRLDPLLVAAPALGVLAGAALGLRTLPVVTRLAQRRFDRRSWVAGTLGMWQAGRRPHAWPVLLLALAVAVSTLAWCLSATARRSVADQADHLTGGDLRVTRLAGQPVDADRLAAVPGAVHTLPVLREELRLGPSAEPATMIALDAGRAAGVVHLRPDQAGGDPAAVFAGLTGDRLPAPVLPAGRLTGTIRVDGAAGPAGTFLVVAVDGGGYQQIDLGQAPDGRSQPFAVDIPAGAGRRLVGFSVSGQAELGSTVSWRLTGLRAAGRAVPLDTVGGWQAHDPKGNLAPVGGGSGGLDLAYTVPTDPGLVIARLTVFTVVAADVSPRNPVPVVATDGALSRLRLRVGDVSKLTLGAVDVDVRITGTVRAVPGTDDPLAVLADLPSLAAAQFAAAGVVSEVGEWWLATGADRSAASADAVRALGRVQVSDRRAAVRSADDDPYGRGARIALFAAALGAVLLAGVGLAVDARATARRRAGELAVLHTLGAGPRLLAGSLVAEQALLAAVGLLVGVAVGIGVAATLAPLVVLTPAAGRPVPPAVPVVPWWPVTVTVLVLAAGTLGLNALISATLRRRLVAARLRIGEPG